MRDVNLRGCNLRNDAAASLGHMLRVNRSVQRLCLEWNSLGVIDSGMQLLAEGLSANSTLRQLDLRNNRIGPSGFISLAHALHANTTLRTLDLRWNMGGTAGGRALAEALATSGSLLELHLSGNEIPEELLADIERLLKRNREEARYRSEAELRDRSTQQGLRDQVASLQSQLLSERRAHDDTAAVKESLARRVTELEDSTSGYELTLAEERQKRVYFEAKLQAAEETLEHSERAREHESAALRAERDDAVSRAKDATQRAADAEATFRAAKQDLLDKISNLERDRVRLEEREGVLASDVAFFRAEAARASDDHRKTLASEAQVRI